MNNIILRGRMTADAETKITTDEKPISISRFSLAVADRTHRNSNGEYDVDFIKMVAFNKNSENISSYTQKGSELLIAGRLHTYTYKNKDGKNVYMAEVICERIEFLNDCKKPTVVEMPDDIDEQVPFK